MFRLDQMTNDRLLKLKTALARHNFTARWQAGTQHLIADAFSRAPRNTATEDDFVLTPAEEADRTFIVAAAVNKLTSLDDQDARLQGIREGGAADATYTALIQRIRDGWPASKAELRATEDFLTPFYTAREHLLVQDGLVLHGPRILIPTALRQVTLQRLHAAHQGVAKTLERARHSVWWPTVASDISHMIRNCRPCREHLPSQPHKPLLHGPEATRPFQKLHADIMQEAGRKYLVLTDEYSGWPCLHRLDKDTTSRAIIEALRMVFVAHMVPVIFKPDGGPQLVSAAVRQFLSTWGVTLEPSSPHLPRTNGRAEAAVKAMKKIVRGATNQDGRLNEDELAAGILAFRNTGRYGGRSPAEKIFGHNLRDALPTHRSAYDPKWTRAALEMDETETTRRIALESHYEKTAKPLQELTVGSPVWVQNPQTKLWSIPGKVVEVLEKHDYRIRQASGRVIRRNRVLLRSRHTTEGPRSSFIAPPEALPVPQAVVPIPQAVVPAPQRSPPAGPSGTLTPAPRRTGRVTKPTKWYPADQWSK